MGKAITERDGDRACPFTTLYWDFLMRHETRLAKNPRMALQVKNLARLGDAQRQAVVDRAASIRRGEVGQRAPARLKGRPSSKALGRHPHYRSRWT